MSLQQAKRLLDKINALHKSMSLDEGEVASIERDLMLSYVRQLYEAFLDINVQSPLTKPVSRPAPAPPPPPPAARHEPEPEPVRSHAEVRQPPPTVQQAPRPEPRPTYQPEPPAPRPEPRPAYQAEQPRPEPERPSYRPEPEPTYRPEPPRDYQPAPRPEPPPQPAYQPEPPRTASTTGDPRLNGLFNFQQARELSEKLGEQRIIDLTKAMTINDRLLFANDLFGGDSRAMMTTLDQLNRFSSMDQARPMLEDLAHQYKWTDDERDDTARNFIKLVRRRYA